MPVLRMEYKLDESFSHFFFINISDPWHLLLQPTEAQRGTLEFYFDLHQLTLSSTVGCLPLLNACG